MTPIRLEKRKQRRSQCAGSIPLTLNDFHFQVGVSEQLTKHFLILEIYCTIHPNQNMPMGN